MTTFKKLVPQPPARADDLDWEDVGLGLYDGETALVLPSGAMVAVSVELTRLTNNAGVVLWGNARWIDKTGATRLDAAGEHVETDVRHTVNAGCIATHPPAEVAREVVMALLGTAPDEPLVQWSDEVRAQASMVVEIAAVKQSAKADVAALLGLG